MSVLDDLAPAVDVDAALRSFRSKRDRRRNRRRAVAGAGIAIVAALGIVGLVSVRGHHGVTVEVPATQPPGPSSTLRFTATSPLSAAQRQRLTDTLLARLHQISAHISVTLSSDVFVVRFPEPERALVMAVSQPGVLQNRVVLGSLPADQRIPPTSSPAGSTNTTTPSLTGKTCADLVHAAPSADGSGGDWFWDQATNGVHRICYLLGPNVLSGSAVTHAAANYDPQENGWGIDITYRDHSFVQKVAQPYVNKNVAIVVDNEVLSAPVIEPGITGNNVRLSGALSETSARTLAIMLRSGPLPTALRLTTR